MQKECINCDLNQVKKICKILNYNFDQEKQLTDLVKQELEDCDMSLTNPEVMGKLWLKITKFINSKDPYKTIKKEYNDLLLSLEDEIKKNIHSFEDILNISIASNLIDFAAKHQFNQEDVKKLLLENQKLKLSINDSDKLKKKILESQSLLYIGDNCGEIVCDKLFIEYIQQMNPNLSITYAVRGQPVVNDITYEDACYVGMDKIANIIDNGTYTLGTVLCKTNQKFKDIFNQSDLIICKGQGNYEGLIHEKRKDIFFLFMAKCEIVAQPLDVDRLSIICMQKNV